MSCSAQGNAPYAKPGRGQHRINATTTLQRDRSQRSQIGILAAIQSSVVGGSEIDRMPSY